MYSRRCVICGCSLTTSELRRVEFRENHWRTGSGPLQYFAVEPLLLHTDPQSTMMREPTPTLPSKSKARKMKATTPTAITPRLAPHPLPAPHPPSPATYPSTGQQVETETNPLEAKATSNTTSLDIYSSFSTGLPRISEIRRFHTEVQDIESRLMENRIRTTIAQRGNCAIKESIWSIQTSSGRVVFTIINGAYVSHAAHRRSRHQGKSSAESIHR